MAFPFKKALITGATSGLGFELAQRLSGEGVHVIATGRRQDRLDALVKKNGAERVTAVAFDAGNINQISGFAQQVLKSHPDLDCVFLNAGVQYVMDFSKPQTVDVTKIAHEVNINYTSCVALAHAFVPHFLSQATETGLVFTTSSLATVPNPMTFNYCATKAALHSFLLSTREQLRAAGSKIRVTELYTPLIQTELHVGQPGWGADFNPGMPVSDYVTAVLEELKAKQESIVIGPIAKGSWDNFEEAKSQRVAPNWELAKKVLGKAQSFD